MAKTSQHASTLLYRAVMFVVASIFAGLLVAGLLIPVAGMAGNATETVTNGMENVPAELETPPQSQRSRVLLANGEVLAHFYEENRVYVPLSEIAPVMRQAQVAIEDHRFNEHGALDARATLRALVSNTSGASGTQGGSSLTQQYVKMVQIESASRRGDDSGVQKAQERTLSRKIQELRFAVALEKRLTKDEILERYLNIAYYGDGAYGVQMAARHYFNTTAKDLTLDQAAMLAGLVQNPTATDPVRNTRAALERRDVVLNRMVDLELIDEGAAEKAKKVGWNPGTVQRFANGCVGTRYPFLCDYVRRSLQKMPALGNTPEERLNTLKRGGLTIETEIDPRTQDAAQRSIDRVLDPRDPVVSTMTMIQPGTGLILGLAQNRPVMGDNQKAGETYYNYAVGGAMSDNDMGGAEGYQAGSTFKPFASAAALEAGIPLGQTYNSAATMDFTGQTFKSCAGRTRLVGDWSVSNSTGVHGQMDMNRAMSMSVNTYFVQLIREAGGCETTKMAQKTGVKLGSKGDIVEEFHDKPSFVLGSAEVTPLSLTEAYATFAARGVHCDPIILKRVLDRDGNEIPVPSADCKQVMAPEVADGINDLLANVMTGTGRPATIPGGYAQAGKTGTTDGNQAVWFAGHTPEVAGVAMIAVDKTHSFWNSTSGTPSLKGLRLPASRYYLSGSGGGDAGQDIYRPSMSAALRVKPKTRFHRIDREIREGRPVTIPDVAGKSPEAAKAALEDAGFNVGRSTRTSTKRAGTYLGISRTGTAPTGATISLVYSSGPPARPDPTQAPEEPAGPSADQPGPPEPPLAPEPPVNPNRQSLPTRRNHRDD